MRKEHGLIMSGDMVRATLANRKGQTRRTQGLDAVNRYPATWRVNGYSHDKNGRFFVDFVGDDGFSIKVFSPWGGPGAGLWIRETARPDYYGKTWQTMDQDLRRPECVVYRADFIDAVPAARWFPAIHMPRWACRITAKNMGIRVERLQDISEADCFREGVRERNPGPAADGAIKIARYSMRDPAPVAAADWPLTPQGAFIEFINELHADPKHPSIWDRNPWVWVLDFSGIEVAK